MLQKSLEYLWVNLELKTKLLLGGGWRAPFVGKLSEGPERV